MRSAAALLLLGLLAGCRSAPHDLAPAASFAAAAADLSAFIEQQRTDKNLPGVSIAVVDRGELIWAAGFGSTGAGATRADTIHRVGSISKLCLDVALLRLVEAGRLDLDAPVGDYLPGFQPANPFGTPITVRHLITHHAGLVREPPVGHYFDDSEPSLAATVDSMNRTTLVYEPGTRAKYSNAGLAVAGRVLEVITGESFALHVARTVLAPLGMHDSTFVLTASLRQRLATGTMWTYDGRQFEAPGFELGMAPAGSLYATVTDLARFAASWSLGAGPAPRRLLQQETLQAMFTPQFSTAGRDSGIGLGFFVGRLDGERRVGHGGAMYGFATELAALPDADCAVAVAVTVDFANQCAERIAERALRWVLASRRNETLPPVDPPVAVGAEQARALAGAYEREGERLQLAARGDELIVEPPRGERVRVRRVAAGVEKFVADDRLAHGWMLRPTSDGVEWRGSAWTRVADDAPPPPPPAAFEPLIGEYGWDHDVLYVLERAGRLCILIEWFELYPLESSGGDDYRLADGGLYAGEDVRFERDARGAVTAVVVGAVRFGRRAAPAAGELFQIDRRLDERALRSAALAASPPKVAATLQADLVDLTTLAPTLRLDVRYATTQNFMGLRFYDEPRARLQRPAAVALADVHRELGKRGLGLVIFDAYRPWYVTKMFWEATPPRLRMFVADPAAGSRHNRGCAVDLSLYELASGQPVSMVSGYDEFTARAYPDYPGGSSRQRWHRELLRGAMEAAGFSVYEAEWWHFDYHAWRSYPILNEPQ